MTTTQTRPAARPRLQRALPATLRRGARPDTAVLGLREGRTNGRLSPPPPARAVVSFVWDSSQWQRSVLRHSGANQTPKSGWRRVNRLPRKGGWEDARAGTTFTDPPSPAGPRPHVQLSSPHLPTRPTQGALRDAGRLRTPQAVTDRPFTPTKTRHLCFHTRREQKPPISDKKQAGRAPPSAGAMAPSGSEPFPLRSPSLFLPPPVAAGRAALPHLSSYPLSLPKEQTLHLRHPAIESDSPNHSQSTLATHPPPPHPPPASPPDLPPTRVPLPYLAEAL